MRLNTFWTIYVETESAICHYAKQTAIKMMYSFIPHLYLIVQYTFYLVLN